jgi:hypothetical protein
MIPLCKLCLRGAGFTLWQQPQKNGGRNWCGTYFKILRLMVNSPGTIVADTTRWIWITIAEIVKIINNGQEDISNPGIL